MEELRCEIQSKSNKTNGFGVYFEPVVKLIHPTDPQLIFTVCVPYHLVKYLPILDSGW